MSKWVVTNGSGEPLRDERGHPRRIAAAAFVLPRRRRTGLLLTAGPGATGAGYLYGREALGSVAPERPESLPPAWNLST
jgi:hypothetical protein